MKVDILYLGKNRDVYTGASLNALVRNTNWNLVNKFVCFNDGSDDLTRNLMVDTSVLLDVPCEIHDTNLGSPVAIMNAFLDMKGAAVFAKIDNDTMMPPGWLDAALGVMLHHPDLGVLGLEPPLSRTPAPWAHNHRPPPPEVTGPFSTSFGHTHGYAKCKNVGGIALIRRIFFGTERMKPHSIYGGFGEWQNAHPEVICGWIVPPIKVFVLDRLPMSPWREVADEYLRLGLQRPWTNYTAADKLLWDWWSPNDAFTRNANR